jgi:hypothetical protein
MTLTIKILLIFLSNLIYSDITHADDGQEKIHLKSDKACQGCAASDVEIKGMSFDEAKKQVQMQQLNVPEISKKNQNQENKSENNPKFLEGH